MLSQGTAKRESRVGGEAGEGSEQQGEARPVKPGGDGRASRLRLEQIGAVTTVSIVSGIAIWGTVHELGPFSQLPLNESLILLQTFTAVVALTTLTLACSASERQAAEDALRQQVTDLEALNDSSQVFLSNLEKKALYESICRLAVERLHLTSAWISLKDPRAAGGAGSAFVYPPDFNLDQLPPIRPATVFPLH